MINRLISRGCQSDSIGQGCPGGPGGPGSQGGQGGPGGPSGPDGQVVQVINVDRVIRVVRVVSLDDMHSDNIWFTWYKLSDYREELRCRACD